MLETTARSSASERETKVTAPGSLTTGRIELLDGWRACSILLVLAGHLLPLGPAYLGLNGAVAATGMALFFILSGLLIVRSLQHDCNVRRFLIRRVFRILPLAWAAMLVLAVANSSKTGMLAANLAFYANLPPSHLMHGGEHLWSLCVEMQFYIAVAGLVAIGKRRALYLLPLLGLAVTAARVTVAEPLSIVTWHRVDEILAGAWLALLISHARTSAICSRLPPVVLLPLAILLLASGSPMMGPLPYLRPYIAASLIGISIFSSPRGLSTIFCSSAARYIATISYAVYVFHGMLTDTWLGQGDKLIKYAKRPLLFLATFGLAHWSTFRFEQPMIAVGKSLSRRLDRTRRSTR